MTEARTFAGQGVRDVTSEPTVVTWRAMASPIRLELVGVDGAAAERTGKAVMADLEATEQALSRFRPTADLVRLNARVGVWQDVSPRLYRALVAAARAHRRTGGRFDPRVLVSLEALGYVGAPRPPLASEEPRREAWVEFSTPRRSSVRIWAPLDLGGIGKGLGVRWAARVARRQTPTFLLDAGGDLLAAGTGPDGTGWKIGVEDPHQPDRLAAALLLPTGGAVCTSSIARRRWQHEGRMVHHLLDPRTGQPGGAGLWSVTVVGPDAAWAEVWSKTLFLTGVDAIARAAVGRPVVWVRDDGRLGLTPEAERLVFWRHGSREGRPMPAPGLPSPLLTPPPAVLPPAWRLG